MFSWKYTIKEDREFKKQYEKNEGGPYLTDKAMGQTESEMGVQRSSGSGLWRTRHPQTMQKRKSLPMVRRRKSPGILPITSKKLCIGLGLFMEWIKNIH